MRPDPERDIIYAPPADEIEHGRNRMWTGFVVVFCFIALAFTNARALERWAAVQPPGWWTETARLMADLWTSRMDMAGFNAPRDAMSDGWDGLKAAGWEELGLGDAQTPSDENPPANPSSS